METRIDHLAYHRGNPICRSPRCSRLNLLLVIFIERPLDPIDRIARNELLCRSLIHFLNRPKNFSLRNRPLPETRACRLTAHRLILSFRAIRVTSPLLFKLSSVVRFSLSAFRLISIPRYRAYTKNRLGKAFQQMRETTCKARKNIVYIARNYT